MIISDINLNKNISVLQVLPAMNSGGVERQVLDISIFLNKNNYNSFVASSGGALVKNLKQNNVKHIEISLNRKNPLAILFNIFKLANIIKKNNIKLVHAHSRLPAWCAYFACKIAKCHFITTLHGAHGTSNFLKRWYNSIMTKGERVITVSKFIAEYAKSNYKFDYNKIKIIHCGIDTNNFNLSNVDGNKIAEFIIKYRIPTDKPIVTLPARFSRNKGHLSLIEAMKFLPKNFITCMFVGDYGKNIKYYEELLKAAKKLDVIDNVTFTGNISDMPLVYAVSDIILSLSTKPEAFGLTSVEAQAMGKKVIVTNIGGIKETIIEKKTGWLIEPNSPEELANKIKTLLKLNPAENKVITTNCIANVNKNFSLALMEKKIIDVYHEIIS